MSDSSRKSAEPPFLVGFVFRVGSKDDAIALRGPIYEQELGSAGVDPADEVATHLIALDKTGLIRACLRVEGEACRPYSFESYVELKGLVRSPSTTVEVSRFVVHPAVRAIRSDQFVHVGMLKLVYDFADKAGLSDIVTLSLPHLNRLYEMAMFKRVSPPRTHPIWGPVQPMHVNLAEARAGARAKPTRLTSMLFDSAVPNIRL